MSLFQLVNIARKIKSKQSTKQTPFISLRNMMAEWGDHPSSIADYIQAAITPMEFKHEENGILIKNTPDQVDINELDDGILYLRNKASSLSASVAYELLSKVTTEALGTFMGELRHKSSPRAYWDHEEKAAQDYNLTKLLAIIPRIVGSSVLCHLCLMHRRLKDYGDKQYKVLPGVAELLSNTSVNGMTTDDLRFPFPAFYIEVPHSAGLFMRTEDKDELGLVEGFYIAVGSLIDKTRTLHINAVRSVNGDPLFLDVDNVNVLLSEGTKLEDVTVLRGESDDPAKLKHNKKSLSWLRWIMNLMLYLSSKEAITSKESDNHEYRALSDRVKKLPKDSTKRNDILARLRSTNPDYCIFVGRGITRAAVAAILRPAGESQLARYWVTSHWHWYWTGPDRTVKEHKWIHAYQKGPLLGVEVNPLRVVN